MAQDNQNQIVHFTYAAQGKTVRQNRYIAITFVVLMVLAFLFICIWMFGFINSDSAPEDEPLPDVPVVVPTVKPSNRPSPETMHAIPRHFNDSSKLAPASTDIIEPPPEGYDDAPLPPNTIKV